MEALFRNFCERHGIPTSQSKNKGMQEKYVHDILENEAIQKYFDEDDTLFFNYLFTNEKGTLNLRNNIAHGFYTINDYSFTKVLLLIAALLRLGKHNYKTKNSIINEVEIKLENEAYKDI